MSTETLEREKKDQGLSAADEQEFQRLAASTGLDEKTGGGDNTPSGDSEEDPPRRRRRFGISRRAKVAGSLFGGGLISAIFSIFTIGQGPAQWIHIAQLIDQIGFEELYEESDEASMRLYRYAKGLKGDAQNTRMNKLGNRFADKYEKHLGSMGLKSTYSPLLGLLDGYEIDRSHPKYAGMTEEQIKTEMKERFGVDVVDKSTVTGDPAHRGSLIVPQESLGFQGNKKFVRANFSEAGLSKINAAIGNRLLTTRAGMTFHPLKKLDQKVLRSVEKFAIEKAVRERRTTYIREGDSAINTNTRPSGNNDAERQNSTRNAEEARRTADSVIEEGQRANSDIAERPIADGPQSRLLAFQSNLAVRLAGGAGAITAIPCLARGVADEAATIKKVQVFIPLIRIMGEMRSFGRGQLLAGQDFDGQQINYFANKLVGIDENGKKHSFFDSEPIRVFSGQKGGRKPNKTLQTMGKGSPFDFLKEGSTGASLDVLCSSGVQGGILVVTFLGGPVSTTVGAVASAILVPAVLALVAEWVSGNAVEMEAMGADWGSQIAFGAFEGGRQAELLRGGAEMPPDQAQIRSDNAKFGANQEFAEKSLAYRLFSPYDYRTPVGKLIDRQAGQDLPQTMASIMGAITSAGKLLMGNVSSLVTGKSSAAINAPMYDFGGLKSAGFTVAEENSKLYQNPYRSPAGQAGKLFDSPNGKTYIDRAKRCNGVDIVKDNDGDWNAVSQPDTIVMPQDSGNPECTSKDPSWIQTRFFIRYTTEQNAAACGVGDDESCGYVGFTNG
ncbi:MAG TPA: hypothetical protein VF733_00420 [Candidatus Saccharimonadales bacterium]